MPRKKVAVIGMACRYSTARNPEEFWGLMMNREANHKPMSYRFHDAYTYYNKESAAKGKFYNQKAFFLDSDITEFDADFFHLSHREVREMDYQQRLLLHVSYEALEDAGVWINGSNTSVYIGAFMQDFLTNTMQQSNYINLSGFHATGSSLGMLANRLSYFYDLHGQSMAIDTACSSSLTALHLACESIANGGCSTALCGGVNIITELGNFITLCKGGFLSKKSICATFSEEADGYARGEGAGVLVLKDMEQAMEDHDRIYCEIVETAVNHDGRTDGITLPNKNAQIALLNKVYNHGNVDINQLDYLETHGTGTQAGDRIELGALQQVCRERREPLVIGSVKPNIGHTEAAAGIASVIKAILVLKYGMIPASIHCDTLNRQLFADGKLLPAKSEMPLPGRPGKRHYIGISGFGFGGSNAHVVVADTEIEKQREEKSGLAPYYNFCLSANSLKSLDAISKDYSYQMKDGTLKDCTLEEICGCNAVRRNHTLAHKLVITAKDKKDLLNKIELFNSRKEHPQIFYSCKSKKYNRTAAVFSGMGAQTLDMGRVLYQNFLVFRQAFQRCSIAFEKYAGYSLSEKMEMDAESVPQEKFFQIGFLQPFYLAYQISLYELICSFGIIIDGFVGHSAGEMAAFYCSGFLSLEEIFRIAWHRGRLQQTKQGKGKMLLAEIGREEAHAICGQYPDKVSLAVCNTKTTVVLSGDPDILDEIKKMWGDQIYCRFLPGTVAYHSIQMEDIREEFLCCMSEKQSCCREDRGNLYSTAYAGKMQQNMYGGGYWWDNIRNTVLFDDTISCMKKDGYDSFIEIGATPVLSHYVSSIYNDRQISYLWFQRKKEDALSAFYEGLAKSYINQIPSDASVYFGKVPMLELPKYHWDYMSFPNRAIKDCYRQEGHIKPLLGCRLQMPEETWEKHWNTEAENWITGHMVDGQNYLPMAVYIGMMVEAGIYSMENVRIYSPVILDGAQNTLLHFARRGTENTVYSSTEERKEWNLCFQANLKGHVDLPQKPFDEGLFVWDKEWLTDGCAALGQQAVYTVLQQKSLQYSGKFRILQRASAGENKAVAGFSVEEPAPGDGENLVLLFDAMLQTAALAGNREINDRAAYIPVGIENVFFTDIQKGNCQIYAEIIKEDEGKSIGNAALFGEDGHLLAGFSHIIFRKRAAAWKQKKPKCYRMEWEGLEQEGISKNAGDGQNENMVIYHAGNGDIAKEAEKLTNLLKETKDQDLRIVVVTRNGVRVHPDDNMENYASGSIWGLCRCFRQEYSMPQLWTVDIDCDELPVPIEDMIQNGEYELAIRKKKLYGLRIIPVKEGKEKTVMAEPEGVAVITGASGGIAHELCIHLASQGVKRIVLISRHITDEMEQLVQALDYFKVQSWIYQGDVTVYGDLEKCFTQIDSMWKNRKITIWHLAGLNEDCPIPKLTKATFEKHLKPKMEGVINLSRILSEREGVLWAAGSVVAMLGNAGQSAYAVANMFLHNFCEAHGYHMIGFGALDTGMAVANENAKKAFGAQGIGITAAREALRAVETFGGGIQYIADVDWAKALEQRNALNEQKYKYVKGQKKQEDSFIERWRKMDMGEQEKLLSHKLREIYARVLDMEQDRLDIDRNTNTMGIHSLNAILIANQMNRIFGTRYNAEMITGDFSIHDLSQRIHRELLMDSD